MYIDFKEKTNACKQDKILQDIFFYTDKYNVDNISRTKAYMNFYRKYPEIRWAFLASMVSRNAGWNMCDLEGAVLSKALSTSYRHHLFLTYEVANYLIFRDAFPQLLLYHYSTKYKQSMFHLYHYFSISSFMKQEWEVFLNERDENRLMTSLIINEQNVIHHPVIRYPFFRKNVFQSRLFLLQDMLHFSTVLFPTVQGELYGASVHQFKNVTSRIQLGKILACILFNKEKYPDFYQFAIKTEHTGSREDYERYFPYRKWRETPYLRTVFPVVEHRFGPFPSWDSYQKVKEKWRNPVEIEDLIDLTAWYERKQKQIRLFASVCDLFGT